MTLHSAIRFGQAALSCSLLSFAFTGCLAEASSSPGGENTGVTDEAYASQYTVPQGLACGLTHTGGPFTGCEGLTYVAGKGGAIPGGYGTVFTGDWGMPSGQGFSHDSVLVTSPSAARFTSDRLPIPAGVTCGLKHSSNAPNERCMGYDAAVSCPAGWARRTAQDLDSCDAPNAGGRCQYWSWCEYQDPTTACGLNPGACIGNVPSGTVCGLGHTPSSKFNVGATVGFCEGIALGASRTSPGGCRDGWYLQGPRDEGGELGAGLVWCVKN